MEAEISRFCGGAYFGCDDGYIYIEVGNKGIYDCDDTPAHRYYFVQYYGVVNLVPQDEFEAHYRNLQYFVDDMGRALPEQVTGERPTEEQRNEMIEKIKSRVL